MKNVRAANYTLFATITIWGTLLGGIVYAHIVYFPVYLSALPDSAVIVNGPYGLNEAAFWGLIHPVLILSLIVTLVFNWKSRHRRKLILISFSVYFVVLIVSQLYFIPELREFKASAQATLSRAEWLARGARWQHLSWIRGSAMFVATLPLLLALTKPAFTEPN